MFDARREGFVQTETEDGDLGDGAERDAEAKPVVDDQERGRWTRTRARFARLGIDRRFVRAHA